MGLAIGFTVLAVMIIAIVVVAVKYDKIETK